MLPKQAACALLSLAFAFLEQATSSAFAFSDFDTTAAAILSKRCIECHNAIERSGELDLTRHDSVRAGGASGGVVIPGSGATSHLIERVTAGEMPPDKNGQSQRLSDSEIELLKQWVDDGAKWPQGRILDLYDKTNDVRAGRDWWSFQPLQARSHPNTLSASHPIDAFLTASLVEHGLTSAPKADKRHLIRRLYHDLIGLPPKAEEIDAFVLDDMPDAYERRVEALLSQPQFGERWARHWLDVVRYADTNGYERDAEKKNAWRYRDWVVNALNQDLPFDQFLIHQLAGDEIEDRNEASVIATGLLRLGTWDDEPNDPAEYQYDRLEDLVHVTCTAFLGLTVKCARCHDHKFDPIYQTDYYRIGAAFWPGPVAHRDRAWNGGPTAQELGFDVLGWTDIQLAPKPLHALKKGNIHRPLQAVAAGPLSCCNPEPDRESFESSEPKASSFKTTQRRLQLAQWMVHPKHPLTARVIVNRLWQHHFGEGIVRTPDNVGFNGAKPTHPELLDWLANELIEHGWSLKTMHRLMVTSQSYQQASIHPMAERYATLDANNSLLWRSHRRRLDAESLRDAILIAAGQLDYAVGGPSFKAPINAEALEGLSMKGQAYKASPDQESMRRSLYMFHKRGLMVPFMTTFDICDSTMPTGRRDATVVPTQALAMLNNDWVHAQSNAMARRVVEFADNTASRIHVLWRNALGRVPTEREFSMALLHLERPTESVNGESKQSVEQDEIQSLASLCHVLFNTNEFIYID